MLAPVDKYGMSSDARRRLVSSLEIEEGVGSLPITNRDSARAAARSIDLDSRRGPRV